MNLVIKYQIQETRKTNEWWKGRQESWIQLNQERWIIEGQRLQERRESLNVSRAYMSRLMEVSYSRLSRLEKGHGVRDANLIRNFYGVLLDNIERETDFHNELSNLLY